MIQRNALQNIKLDERNHVEMQHINQVTGKKRVTPLLTEPQEDCG